jgi:tetratricopeptide (TPR) repeat protein
MMRNLIPRLVPVAALALLLCLFRSAPAARAATSPELQTGIALVERHSYALAATVLRGVVEQNPKDVWAAYYLGAALNRTGGGKEAERLLKVALREYPEHPGVNFELGLHYYRKEVLAEAGDYFEQVIELSPTGSMGARARDYLKQIEERGKGKPWELSVLAGAQYDSNVILGNGSQPLPSGYSHRGDFSTLLNLKGSFTPLKNQTWEVNAGYSLYQNLHATLGGFDVTQNLLEFSVSRFLTPRLRLKGNYGLEYLLLGGSAYNYTQSVSPSLSFQSENLGVTTLDYHYATKSYWNSAAFTGSVERNGDNHLFGLSQVLPLGEATTLWLLYSHDLDLTRNAALGYSGDRLLAGCRRQLPWGIAGDLSGEVYWRGYQESDPAYGVRRDDTQYTVSLSLSRNIWERYSLTFAQVLGWNRSNITDFAYTRGITSVLANARF